MEKNIKDISGNIIVQVIKTPISERYCKIGDEATLDLKNNKIRCGGAWFNFDERWAVKY